MSEEVKPDVKAEDAVGESVSKVENKTEETVVSTPEPTPVELEAREQGWVSKEEWVESGRDADDWRPAKEFVERGELYKSIHQTKRELKQTQAALEMLGKHHQKVYDKAYQTALNDLKMQKRAAIREQDFEAAEEIDDQIDTLKEEHQTEKQQLAVQQQTSSVPPEFNEFLNRNPWYAADKAMRDEADAIGFVYLNNGGTQANLLTHVEKKIKEKFPEKFGKVVKRAAPSAVAAPNKAPASRPAADTELDENEREVMKTFVRMGVMTEQQYKDELKKAKGRS